MKYHQTYKSKHGERISVLNKVEDKYNYDNMQFPASCDDVTQFEENKKVCVFIYRFENDNIYREKLGNPAYIPNDTINLLRFDAEAKSHYIYIKHVSRLLNLNHFVTSKDKEWCPYCEKHTKDDLH